MLNTTFTLSVNLIATTNWIVLFSVILQPLPIHIDFLWYCLSQFSNKLVNCIQFYYVISTWIFKIHCVWKKNVTPILFFCKKWTLRMHLSNWLNFVGTACTLFTPLFYCANTYKKFFKRSKKLKVKAFYNSAYFKSHHAYIATSKWSN